MSVERDIELTPDEVDRLATAIGLDAVDDGRPYKKRNMQEAALQILRSRGLQGFVKSVEVESVYPSCEIYKLRFEQ